MKLLLPVRRWIARKPVTRKPTSRPDWFEGLNLTQEDIDRELLLSLPTSANTGNRPTTVTWIPLDGAR